MSTVLLMHFDGTDGSTVFTDSSLVSTHFSVDIGSPVISTTQFKFGGAAYKGNIAAAPGTQSDAMGNSSFFDIFTSDFTVEFFAYFLNNWSSCTWLSFGTGQPTGSNDFSTLSKPRRIDFVCDSLGKLIVYYYDDSSVNSAGGFNSTLVPSTWTHVAFVRASNKLYCYMNGVQDAITYPSLSTTAYSGITYCAVGGGRGSAAQKYVQGYMDELRVSNTALYTSSFTPPSTAFPDPVAPPMIGVHT